MPQGSTRDGCRVRCPRVRRRPSRRGATVVESALVLPVFFALLYGIVEYGHAQMVVNTLNASARHAVRYSSTNGVTSEECKEQFNTMMGAVCDASKINVMVKDANVYDTDDTEPATADDFAALPDIDLEDAPPRRLFLVRATVNYNDVALIGMPFMKNVTLTGQAISRHE